jgi:uracil-DNA glycosylase family 4
VRGTSGHRVALSGDGSPVAASGRTGQRGGTIGTDLRKRGTSERQQCARGNTGRCGELRCGDVERHQGVARKARGGVVRGAVFLGNVDRHHPEAVRDAAQRRGIRRAARSNGGTGTFEGTFAGRHADQRVQHAAALVGGREVKRSRAAGVHHEPAGRDDRRRRANRSVRDAQHDDVRVRCVGSAPKRGDASVKPGGHEGPVKRGSESTLADYRELREGEVLHCRSSSKRMPVAIECEVVVKGVVGSCPSPVLARAGLYTSSGIGSTIRRVSERTPDDPGAPAAISGALPLDPGAAVRRELLKATFLRARACEACPQLVGARTHVVFGGGNADADLLLIGEAPGPREDAQGQPFVGAAGMLLDELLASIGLSRADVFITTALKCRPPGNRDPSPTEMARCQTYLDEQIAHVRPRVIATLGNVATRLLRTGNEAISVVHGRAEVVERSGRSMYLVPLYHPAAALYTRSLLNALRDDVATLAELLARPELPCTVGVAGDVGDDAGDPPV